jgi:hypothetical protein
VISTEGLDPTLCATQNDHPQTYTENVGDFRYYASHFSNLHGIYVYSANNAAVGPTTIADFTLGEQLGIKADSPIATVSATVPQSGYLPFVQTIKRYGSTFAYDGAAIGSSVELGKEAQLQGVNSVKVWASNSGDYSTVLTQECGSACDHLYTMIPYLPFLTEYQDNPALNSLVQELGGINNFDSNSLASFIAALLFQDAVQKDVASGTTLSRESLVHVLKTNETAFNADGIIGATDVSAGAPSPCIVMVETVNGQWQRVSPTKPGTFDCSAKNIAQIKLNIAQQ